MADNKKYYWLKLKNDFFTQKEIKKLRQIAGGDTFTIIYLKMQLLSIKNSGVIEFEGTEDSLAEQLSFEIDEDMDNIKITLSFLQANKLLEQINDKDFVLNKVPELIGSETTAAERMRKMREKRNSVTPVLQGVRNCYTEIEKELDIEIDKDIDIELEKEKEIDKPKKRKRFTPPTLNEVTSYCKERKNNVDAQRFVDYYTSNGWLVGKNKMKDWKAAVRTWERNSKEVQSGYQVCTENHKRADIAAGYDLSFINRV